MSESGPQDDPGDPGAEPQQAGDEFKPLPRRRFFRGGKEGSRQGDDADARKASEEE
jgi:hypothetical protein